MSYKKLFWGILLVIIGTLFILKNLGWIFFDWWTVFRLWPLILILWGISIIPIKGYVKLILSLVTVAVAILLMSKFDKRERPFANWHRHNHEWRFDMDDSDDDSTYNSNSQELFQLYDSTTKRAVLSFDAAAGDFTIADSTLGDKLLVFRKKGNIGDYSMTSSKEGDREEIKLKINESDVKLNNRGNMVKLVLNPKPVWDFNFDIGAANIDFDLSNFMVQDLKVEGGASSINLKMGNKSPLTNVKIEAGAASIDIKVPASTGVDLRAEMVLSSKTLKGFNKVEGGHYRSNNYATAKNKMIINIDAGVSSLNIERY